LFFSSFFHWTFILWEACQQSFEVIPDFCARQFAAYLAANDGYSWHIISRLVQAALDVQCSNRPQYLKAAVMLFRQCVFWYPFIGLMSCRV
jgi:hypothetical protein